MVNVVDDFETGTIPVVAQGKAYLIEVIVPPNFTPNVDFHMKSRTRNDGGDDYLFVKLTNTDTGAVLKNYTNPWITQSGGTWEHDMIVTLDQTTAFNWLVEVGHVV